MWIKDKNDKYVFGNKRLRDDLFNGAELIKIIGKTDTEIIEGVPLPDAIHNELIGITPQDLPDIMDYLEAGTRICNLTDLITKAFKKVCTFIEQIDDKILIVQKKPIIDGDRITGTIGYYIDLTNDADGVANELMMLQHEYKAFRIDSTNNFYIMHPKKPEWKAGLFI
jgi:hypothetical protein